MLYLNLIHTIASIYFYQTAGTTSETETHKGNLLSNLSQKATSTNSFQNRLQNNRFQRYYPGDRNIVRSPKSSDSKINSSGNSNTGNNWMEQKSIKISFLNLVKFTSKLGYIMINEWCHYKVASLPMCQI